MYHLKCLFTEMTSDEVSDIYYGSEMSCSVFLLLFRFAYLHWAQQANREGDFLLSPRFCEGRFFVCLCPWWIRSIDRSMFRLPRAIAWIPYELRSKSIVAKYSRCNNGHDTIHDSLNQYGTVPIYGGLQYLYLIRMSHIWLGYVQWTIIWK